MIRIHQLCVHPVTGISHEQNKIFHIRTILRQELKDGQEMVRLVESEALMTLSAHWMLV